MTVTRAARALGLIAAVLAGCAGAPLRLYTLNEPSDEPDPPALERDAPVVFVDRVSLPAYLDTQDIIVRRGHLLERSQTGRWASRLSVGATELLAARLAARRPDMLVTDVQPAVVPAYEVRVQVDELDVTSGGEAVVQAEWQIVPRADASRANRGRIRFLRHGSVATDDDVVRFEAMLFEQLANAIDIANVH